VFLITFGQWEYSNVGKEAMIQWRNLVASPISQIGNAIGEPVAKPAGKPVF